MSADDQLFERFGKAYSRGDILFKDGDPGTQMYVIQTGKVRIVKAVRGVEKTLAVLPPGEFFGEMSILNNKPRSATAVIEEDGTRLLVIDPKTFEAMVRSNAEIAVRMIKKLAQRLQEADDQIETLLLKDANSRVVHALTAMAGKLGRQVEGGVQIDVTMKDLAAKVGLEVDQVNGVVNKLIKARLVRILDTGFLVSEVNKLREFLEFLEMKEKFGDI